MERRKSTWSRRVALALSLAMLLPSATFTPSSAEADLLASDFLCAVRVVRIVPVAARTYAMETVGIIAGPMDVTVALFTRTHSYDLSLRGQRFDAKPLVKTDMPFAAMTFFSLPDDESVEAAYAMDSIANKSGISQRCTPVHFVLWDALRPQPLPETHPAAGELEARRQLALAFKDGAQVTAAVPRQHDPPVSCPQPYQSMHLTFKAEPAYPEGARQLGQAGTVAIQVDYAPESNTVTTRVSSGSGWPILDDAANTAAKKSRYSPEIFRCEPQRGSYLFVIQFTARQ